MLRDKSHRGVIVAVITVAGVLWRHAHLERVIAVAEALGALELGSSPEGNRETWLTCGN